MLTFEAWLAEKTFDAAALTDAQKAPLLAAWKAEVTPRPPEPQPPRPEERMEKLLADARAEEERKDRITDLVARAVGDRPDRINDVQTLGKIAIEAKWEPQRVELEMLRMLRPQAPGIAARREPESSAQVIECAVARNAGLQSLEKAYDEKTLEASHAHFAHGLSLCDLIMYFARRGGYTGHNVKSNIEGALRAARRAPDIQAVGSWGPSTSGASLGAMLANVANKFLRDGFMSVEMAWQQIAARRTASDFKQITTYSLTGDLTFKKVPPGGEIQHGQVDATSYTNQVDTYARMLGLDRRDIINDDLGAFGSVSRRLGRGGGIALNKLFWGIFLNNSSFFTAGRNNLITGGGTTLQLSQLDVLNQKLLLQTDPDGNILGVKPAILLVPPALWATATTLMSSTSMVSGATTAPGIPSQNIFAGMFRVVSSAYMQDSTLTGNSSTAWYLLADPNDLPVIEVAFLNGVETPTVEQTDSDFGMLGQAFRGYFDIGVALQEYRGGAKSAGA